MHLPTPIKYFSVFSLVFVTSFHCTIFVLKSYHHDNLGSVYKNLISVFFIYSIYQFQIMGLMFKLLTLFNSRNWTETSIRRIPKNTTPTHSINCLPRLFGIFNLAMAVRVYAYHCYVAHSNSLIYLSEWISGVCDECLSASRPIHIPVISWSEMFYCPWFCKAVCFNVI